MKNSSQPSGFLLLYTLLGVGLVGVGVVSYFVISEPDDSSTERVPLKSEDIEVLGGVVETTEKEDETYVIRFTGFESTTPIGDVGDAQQSQEIGLILQENDEDLVIYIPRSNEEYTIPVSDILGLSPINEGDDISETNSIRVYDSGSNEYLYIGRNDNNEVVLIFQDPDDVDVEIRVTTDRERVDGTTDGTTGTTRPGGQQDGTTDGTTGTTRPGGQQDGTTDGTTSTTPQQDEVVGEPGGTGVAGEDGGTGGTPTTSTGQPNPFQRPIAPQQDEVVGEPGGTGVAGEDGGTGGTPTTSTGQPNPFQRPIAPQQDEVVGEPGGTGVAGEDGGTGVTGTTINEDPENNTPPTITSLDPPTTAVEGVQYIYKFEAEDGDEGDFLRWSLVSKQSGNARMTRSGTFTWTPTEEDGGSTRTFSVRVSDGSGGSVTLQLPITVTEVNENPEITPESLSARVGVEFLHTIEALDTDIPIQNLSYEVVGNSLGATIDQTSGVFRWTPNIQQKGEQNIRVQVSDSEGGLSVTTFSFVVSDSLVIAITNPDKSPEKSKSISAIDNSIDTSSFRYKVIQGDLACNSDVMSSGVSPYIEGSRLTLSQEILNGKKLCFVSSDQYETVYKASDVIRGIDREAPTYLDITSSSDNVDSNLQVGDTLTISFIASEPLSEVPEVLINDEIATVSQDETSYSSTLAITEDFVGDVVNDVFGSVGYSISAPVDIAGNLGIRETNSFEGLSVDSDLDGEDDTGEPPLQNPGLQNPGDSERSVRPPLSDNDHDVISGFFKKLAITSGVSVAACLAGDLIATGLSSLADLGLKHAFNALSGVPFVGGFFGGLADESPQKTKDVALSAKECVRDTLVQGIVLNTLHEFQKGVANWITSDFNGKPTLIRNPDQYWDDVLDRELGHIIENQGWGDLCDISGRPLNIDLIFKDRKRDAPRCEAGDIIQRLENLRTGVRLSARTGEDYDATVNGHSLREALTEEEEDLPSNEIQEILKSYTRYAGEYHNPFITFDPERHLNSTTARILAALEEKEEVEEKVEDVRENVESGEDIIVSPHKTEDCEETPDGELGPDCVITTVPKSLLVSQIEESWTANLRKQTQADEIGEAVAGLAQNIILKGLTGIFKDGFDVISSRFDEDNEYIRYYSRNTEQSTPNVNIFFNDDFINGDDFYRELLTKSVLLDDLERLHEYIRVFHSPTQIHSPTQNKICDEFGMRVAPDGYDLLLSLPVPECFPDDISESQNLIRVQVQGTSDTDPIFLEKDTKGNKYYSLDEENATEVKGILDRIVEGKTNLGTFYNLLDTMFTQRRGFTLEADNGGVCERDCSGSTCVYRGSREEYELTIDIFGSDSQINSNQCTKTGMKPTDPDDVRNVDNINELFDKTISSPLDKQQFIGLISDQVIMAQDEININDIIDVYIGTFIAAAELIGVYDDYSRNPPLGTKEVSEYRYRAISKIKEEGEYECDTQGSRLLCVKRYTERLIKNSMNNTGEEKMTMFYIVNDHESLFDGCAKTPNDTVPNVGGWKKSECSFSDFRELHKNTPEGVHIKSIDDMADLVALTFIIAQTTNNIHIPDFSFRQLLVDVEYLEKNRKGISTRKLHSIGNHYLEFFSLMQSNTGLENKNIIWNTRTPSDAAELYRQSIHQKTGIDKHSEVYTKAQNDLTGVPSGTRARNKNRFGSESGGGGGGGGEGEDDESSDGVPGGPRL